MLAGDGGDEPLVTVTGVPHSRRPLSKRLIFYDVHLEHQLAGQEAVEVVLKATQARTACTAKHTAHLCDLCEPPCAGRQHDA